MKNLFKEQEMLQKIYNVLKIKVNELLILSYPESLSKGIAKTIDPKIKDWTVEIYETIKSDLK